MPDLSEMTESGIFDVDGAERDMAPKAAPPEQ